MSAETGFIRGGSDNIAEVVLVDATTGAAYAGTVTVHVDIDGQAQTLGTVNSGLATSMGNGVYQYYPSALESTGTKCSFVFTGTGAVPGLAQYWPISPAQSQALQTATGAGIKYVLTIIKNALYGLNVLSPRETLKPDDANYCLSQLQIIFDDLNADIQSNYATRFVTVASTGANPETIGPSGTIVETVRPVQIDGLSYDLGSGLFQPVYVTSDPKWWQVQQLVTTGTVLFGAFYSPDEPNGSLHLAGLPATGTDLQLMLRTNFASVALTDALSLAPGYESALTLTLQENVAEAFHATVTPSLMQRAGKARARIFANNLRIPALRAAAGTPGLCNGGWFDIQTRQWR